MNQTIMKKLLPVALLVLSLLLIVTHTNFYIRITGQYLNAIYLDLFRVIGTSTDEYSYYSYSFQNFVYISLVLQIIKTICMLFVSMYFVVQIRLTVKLDRLMNLIGVITAGGFTLFMIVAIVLSVANWSDFERVHSILIVLGRITDFSVFSTILIEVTYILLLLSFASLAVKFFLESKNSVVRALSITHLVITFIFLMNYLIFEIAVLKGYADENWNAFSNFYESYFKYYYAVPFKALTFVTLFPLAVAAFIVGNEKKESVDVTDGFSESIPQTPPMTHTNVNAYADYSGNSNAQWFIATKSDMFPTASLPLLNAELSKIEESKFIRMQMLDLQSPNTMLIISIVGGSLGIDRFMLGQTGLGVLKLLTVGGCGIWTIIDWFLITNETKKRNLEKLHRMVQFMK